jgi:hypothetical protein
VNEQYYDLGNYRSLIERPPWQQKANCHDMDTELFFPLGKDISPEVIAACGSCVVRQECFDYAYTHHEPRGIWGGSRALDIAKLRRADEVSVSQSIKPQN